jgi:predicted small metal-binding protein
VRKPPPDGESPRRFANRCACGWTIEGTEQEVVDATIDHGKRIHNMDATRADVLAALQPTDDQDRPLPE